MEESRDEIEWKLYVRAEYHYDLSLYQKTFSALREYVALKKLRAKQFSLAEKYSRYRLRSKVWNGWRQYISDKLENTVRKAFSQRHFNTRIKQNAFHIWKTEYKKKVRHKGMAALSDIMRSRFLKKAFYKTWRNNFKDKLILNLAEESAQRLHKRSVMKRAWFLLKEYMVRCSEENQVAEKFLQRNISSKYFREWEENMCLKQDKFLRPKYERAEKYYVTKEITKYFCSWKRFVKNLKLEKMKEGIAVGHFRKVQLQSYLCKLKGLVVAKRQKVVYKDLQVSFHRRNVLRRYFSIWMFEFQEEQKLLEACKTADKFYSANLCHLVMMNWHYCAVENAETKAKDTKAVVTFNRKLVRKALIAWKEFTELSLLEEQKWNIAKLFNRKRLLLMTFKCFTNGIKTVQREAFTENLSKDFWRQKMIAKIFYSLRNNALHKVKQKIRNEKSLRFHRNFLFGKYFGKWTEKYYFLCELKAKESFADKHYHTHICKKFFSMLKCYTLWKVVKRERRDGKVAEYVSKRNKKLLRRTWKVFSQQVLVDILDRKKIEAAVAYYNNIMSLKCLSAWKQFRNRQFHRKLLFHKADELYGFFFSAKIFLQFQEGIH